MKSLVVKMTLGVSFAAMALAGCSSTSSEPAPSPTPVDFCTAYVNFEVESMRIAKDYEAAGGEQSADFAPYQQRLTSAFTTMQTSVPSSAPAGVQTVFAEMVKALQDENYKPNVQQGQQEEMVNWIKQTCPNIEADLQAKKEALLNESATPAPTNS